VTDDVETPGGRYVGRGDDTGRNVLWWVPPGGAPWERLPYVRHRSVDGPNWGYEGNGPTDAAEAILLHATADLAAAQRHAQTFAADVLAHEPIDRHLDLPATTVERWILQRDITLAAGWSFHGPQPVIRHWQDADGTERYAVALDGWDLLRIDLPDRSPAAIVGVADLKSRRELRWSKPIAVAEPGDAHEPGAAGARVNSEALPFGEWVIQVDGFDVVIVERDGARGTDARVAVYDRTPDSGFLVFDEFVRYRQLASEPVAIGELLRRFSGTTGRDRLLGR
jgi:hypothetical protein